MPPVYLRPVRFCGKKLRVFAAMVIQGFCQLLVFNEEFLVSASHQLALTTSLPFVHTARRSYRLNGPVKCSDCGDVGGSLPATL